LLGERLNCDSQLVVLFRSFFDILGFCGAIEEGGLDNLAFREVSHRKYELLEMRKTEVQFTTP